MANASSNRHGWTPERRARQAEAVKAWRPWERSTGPRSPEGKRKSALNGSRRTTAPIALGALLRDLEILQAAGFLNGGVFGTSFQTTKGRR